MSTQDNLSWLDEIQWNDQGLIPAVAQDLNTGKILTLAWMNRESLSMTVQNGQAVYWSRSRQTLWKKGEESGHTQEVEAIYLDCDRDTVVLKVRQTGNIACHTGRETCFYQRLENGRWITVEPVIKDPGKIYGKK